MVSLREDQQNIITLFIYFLFKRRKKQKERKRERENDRTKYKGGGDEIKKTVKQNTNRNMRVSGTKRGRGQQPYQG